MSDYDNVIPLRPGAMPPGDTDLGTCYVSIESGPDAGKRFGPLDELTTIGQEGWADIGLSDPQVSSQECELQLTPRGVRIRDLSGNGVEWGSARVLDAMLMASARITVGSTTLFVQLERGTRTRPTPTSDPSGTLLGSSEAMRWLYHKMERVAPLDQHVTIAGPIGTETGDVAQAIHLMSKRPGELQLVDCSRVAPEDLEAALFGWVRGAFDGADCDCEGLFERARGGSVLLHQVRPMPPSVQAKLLSVLEGGPVRRVGSDHDIEVKFRAFFTLRRPDTEFRSEMFQQALYDRMTDIEIEVPPLLDRKEDLEMLALNALERMVRMLREMGGDSRVTRLSNDARAALREQVWSGNLLEMDQVMFGAMVLAESSTIERDDLFFIPWAVFHVRSLESDLRLSQRDPAMVEEAISRVDDIVGPFFRRLFRRTQGDVSRAALVTRLPRAFVGLMKERFWEAR